MFLGRERVAGMNAKRAQGSECLDTVRLLTAALKQKEVDNRMDLADKESSELKVLQAYLPARLSGEG